MVDWKNILDEFPPYEDHPTSPVNYWGPVDAIMPSGGCVILSREEYKIARTALSVMKYLHDEEFADRIGRNCHDDYHDDRWCSTCESRIDGINEYRDAIFEKERSMTE